MKKYRTTNDAGENVEITAEDVLVHVFEEGVHHRGRANLPTVADQRAASTGGLEVADMDAHFS